MLDDGTTMAPEVVLATVGSPTDLYGLLDREAGARTSTGLTWFLSWQGLSTALDVGNCPRS